MNDAEHVRQHLAAARAEGLSFDEAWDQALASLPAVRGGRRSLVYGARQEWVGALRSTRAAWAAAYTGEPEVAGEAAVRDLEELLVA